jgi:hypothetical protein
MNAKANAGVFILGPCAPSIYARRGAVAAPVGWPGGPNSMEETFMARSGMFSSNKSILVLVACICFAIAVLTTAGVLSLGKISWTDLGLFFGFLSFLF